MTGTNIPIIISHRGNLNGPNKVEENKPNNILDVLKHTKFNVEIDIWKLGNRYYIGHDYPESIFNLEAILEYNNRILFHAKNLQALEELTIRKLHVFWHENDDFTLSSYQFIVTYPTKTTTYMSIIMKPELYTLDSIKSCYAICTDYPYRWSEILWK